MSGWESIRNPRRKCQRLDIHGKRCGHIAKWRGDYHGAEYYGYEEHSVPWVVIELCHLHMMAAK